ncbi:MAG: APC family permease [Actinomycetes bacterium]
MKMQGSGNKLSKSLNIWEVIGISIALMAPSMAANINPQGPASVVGTAVPLAFFIAAIGVALVSYGFIRLTQAFNHAGSVYGLVGKTLGPRTGVIAGWGLLGTYIFYTVVSTMATGVFGTALLDQLGLVTDAGGGMIPFIIGGLGLVIVTALALSSVKRGTRLLLIVESATVVLILLTTLVVLYKLLTGTAPDGQVFTMSVFSIPAGLDSNTIFLGVVFGFLSFAGFEASATMGEEANAPRRDIPKAILGVVLFGGVYFTFVTAIEVMGFGANEAGMKNFVGSGSLLGDLGSTYIGSWVGLLITIGVTISAMGCLLASMVGAARMLYALGRDAEIERFTKISDKNKVPTTAVYWVSGAVAVFVIFWKLAFSAGAFDVFVGAGVIGTLILLVAYGLATVGAIRFLFFSGKQRAPKWEIIIPVLGLAVLVYTLFRNVWPLPTTGAGQAYDVITIGWILIAIIGVVAAPKTAKKMGDRLNADENLIETS